ncbi:MAG: hypothetical protein NTX50_03945 [Candidatus Sumerlaeota bacterium]|nr:hypothetical protein [Candidatus Sumerlaeota bacterium]
MKWIFALPGATTLALLGAAILSSSADAAVAEGENLLVNGAFDAEQVAFPEFWSVTSDRNVLYRRAGGPDGKKASIVLQGDAATPGEVSVRQQGMTLVAGETYKLSAYIKTKGLKCRHGGLVIHNGGWTSDVGFKNLPTDSDWMLMEKTFTLFPSRDKEYGLAMFAGDLTGEMHFADLKLEAVSAGARKGSSTQMSIVAAPRLVPFQPLLNRIPRANPELTLKFFGTLNEKQDAYECLVFARADLTTTPASRENSPASQSVSLPSVPSPSLPFAPPLQLKDSKILIPLSDLPCGDYSLKAELRHAGTRATILGDSYPISIVDIPVIDRSRIKQLNNLVAEVLDEPIRAIPSPQTFTFVNPHDGWVFVAFIDEAVSKSRAPESRAPQLPGPSPQLTVTLDNRDTVITSSTDRLEAFRELSMGEHRVTVAGVPVVPIVPAVPAVGNAKSAATAAPIANAVAPRLIVRSIPEIFDYPPCADSQVKENGSYGWEFMKKNILYAVTTLNGGSLPGPALPEAKARGLKWLANFNVAPVDDPANVQARMEKHAGMTQPQYDGFTSDELFFGRATIDNYTKALWRLRNPERRLIYTWIVGKPSISALHTDFMSAALNASGGRGRLLFEAYCHPQTDEKAAAAYLDNMIAETMRRFNAFYPGAASGTGIIFGNFNQIPIISLEHDPAVDFKYFLDMQVNLVANSPDFAGLATTGYWGTYYGDEELARWSFKLMRHYAVEGNKDMLSARYGFKYNPGHLTNCDFADGLKGWTLAPAAEGAIRADTISGYGKNSQGRWGAGKAGDAVCVLTRHAGKPNRITQTASGLTPGKLYSLQFVTADRKDVLAKKYNPRPYGIAADLEGFETFPDKSFTHIDRRNSGRYEHNDNVAKINLHRIVFRTDSATQAISFTDEKAAPGEELIINFIQLKPYLE